MSPLPRREPDGADGGVPVAGTGRVARVAGTAASAGRGGGTGDAQAAALGEAGRARVEARFTAAAMIDQFAALYEQLARAKGISGPAL